MTLRQQIEEAMGFYKRKAQAANKKALEAPDGSAYQNDKLRFYEYNRGRADAYKEFLDMIGVEVMQMAVAVDKGSTASELTTAMDVGWLYKDHIDLNDDTVLLILESTQKSRSTT